MITKYSSYIGISLLSMTRIFIYPVYKFYTVHLASKCI